MGLVAQSPIPAPGTVDCFIQSLIIQESLKIGGSQSSSYSEFIINEQSFALKIKIINQIKIKFMDSLKKIWDKPIELAAALSGVGLLGFYWFYARGQLFNNSQLKKQKNILEMDMNQLTKKNNDNIIKIVITESIANKLQFRTKLITRLKQFLLQHKQQTLVNCAPLKLFDAGAEVFTTTLTRDDVDDQNQLKSYFINALKCQLIMEKTITDIFSIKNNGEKVFVLCDTNSIDLKIKIDQDLWQKFLQEQNIDQKDLKNNYKVVFHIMSPSQVSSPKIKARKRSADKIQKMKVVQKSDDRKIQEAWSGNEEYYQLQYDYVLQVEQNVNQAMEKIIRCLKPYLPSDVEYKSKSKFNQKKL